MNDAKAKRLWAVVLVAALCGSAEAERADEATIIGECRDLRLSARSLFGSLPEIGAETTPAERGRARLREAAAFCGAAAERAREASTAAELKAQEVLAHASLAPSSPGTGEEGRLDILLEGLDTVRGLANDRSPATIEILRKAGSVIYYDDPVRGLEMLELAVNISRSAYGREDPRHADSVLRLGLALSPARREGGKVNAKRSERLLKEALEIFLMQDSPSQYPGYRQTLGGLRRLFEATGRESEAEELREVVVEAYAEISREREAKALEEEPEPPAEDEEGENAPTTAKP